MLKLPLTFFGRGSIGIRGVGGSIDSLQGIIRSTNRMRGNMGRCHRLTCSTGSRTSRTILSDFTGSGMRCKRSVADDSHPKHPRIYPRLECFDSVSRAMVFWVPFLKVGQDALDTINCPDG